MVVSTITSGTLKCSEIKQKSQLDRTEEETNKILQLLETDDPSISTKINKDEIVVAINTTTSEITIRGRTDTKIYSSKPSKCTTVGTASSKTSAFENFKI